MSLDITLGLTIKESSIRTNINADILCFEDGSTKMMSNEPGIETEIILTSVSSAVNDLFGPESYARDSISCEPVNQVQITRE